MVAALTVNDSFNNIGHFSDGFRSMSRERNLGWELLASEQKLFADAYGLEKVCRNFSRKSGSIEQAQLREMEARVLMDMLFMAAIYGYYERLSFHHLASSFSHWSSKPRAWLSRAEKSGRSLAKEWQHWTNDNKWQDWGSGKLAGRLIAQARDNLGSRFGLSPNLLLCVRAVIWVAQPR